MEIEMNIREPHTNPLNHGRTNGKNIPHMPDGKFFAVGYNSRYGLLDVCEDNGTPYLEGQVNIEKLLAYHQTQERRDANSIVDNHIMDSYGTPRFGETINKEELLADHQARAKKDIDSKVEDHIMDSYQSWWDNHNQPEKQDKAPEPMLEVLTYRG